MFMSFVVIATSIWMAADAAQLGYDKRDIKGLAAIGPAGWLFAGLLLWIVAFPLYLLKRSELRAAGLRRRQLDTPARPPLPPGPYDAHFVPGSPVHWGPSPAPHPAPPPRTDVLDDIVKLDELRTRGLLTDDEFEKKKAELLARG